MFDRSPEYRRNKRTGQQFGSVLGSKYKEATGRKFPVSNSVGVARSY